MQNPERSAVVHNDDAAASSEGKANTGKWRSPRFTKWLFFFVCSIVTLGSSLEAVRVHKVYTSNDIVTSRHKWTVACSTITFLLTTAVVVMHLHPVSSLLIVGTKLEGALILILLAFWCAIVAVVSDSQNGLAVNAINGAVTFGNLYYFSWAGFVTSITLLTSFVQSWYQFNVTAELRNKYGKRLTYWSALLASSFVVMGSASTLFDNHCDVSDKAAKYCNRTGFAVTVGVVGVLVCLVNIALQITSTAATRSLNAMHNTNYARAPLLFVSESACAMVLFVLYAFGVAYITSEEGPGAPLGNLYYSSWMSFGLSFVLVTSCYEDYVAAKMTAERANNENNSVRNMDFGEDHESRLTGREVGGRSEGQQQWNYDDGSLASNSIGKRPGAAVGEVSVS